MTEAERRRAEDDAKRLEWDTYTLATGSGFHLTNEEAAVVLRIVTQAIAKSTSETLESDIGGQDGLKTAMRLVCRLAPAMPDKVPD